MRSRQCRVSIPSFGSSWSVMDRRALGSPRLRLTSASPHVSDSWVRFRTSCCSAGCAPRVSSSRLPGDGGSGSLVTEARVAGVAVVASDLPVHRQAAGRPGLGPVVFVAPRGSPLDVADAIEEAARLPITSSAALLPSSATSWESVIDSTWRLYRAAGWRFSRFRAGDAPSEVVDLTPQLPKRRPSGTEPVISGLAQSGAEQGNARVWWQSRRRFEQPGCNGARRWP